jgi:hypothetical protein
MDSALKLRIEYDKESNIPRNIASNYLDKSKLIKRLTKSLPNSPLTQIWRIVALSEIPFSFNLEYTQKLTQSVIEDQFTGMAFSLDKKDSGILPCYNAMVVRALIRLGVKHQSIDHAIQWILKYQPMERNEKSKWHESGIKKYGGCFNATPCFIGLTKSVRALVEFNLKNPNSISEQKIEQGIEYILKHNLTNKLTNGQAITNHIQDISFPESYNLNIIELLQLMVDTKKLKDKRIINSIDYLKSKKVNDQYWNINYIYSGNGYISFDSLKKKGDWVTYLINSILNQYDLGKNKDDFD